MSWEVRKKEKNGEYILNKIKENTNSHIGFLVFGPDFSSKEEIVDEICSHTSLIKVSGSRDIESKETVEKLLSLPPYNDGLIIVMSGEESVDHKKRHKAVEWLKEFNLGAIVGIYARRIHDQSSNPEAIIRNTNQLMDMIKNPPTTEGLDYFIIVK